MLIPAYSYHRTVRFKTDCMGISRIRRHMNITSNDRDDLTPIAYITLTVFIIAHCRYRPVGLKTNGMTTARRYRIVMQSFRLLRSDGDIHMLF